MTQQLQDATRNSIDDYYAMLRNVDALIYAVESLQEDVDFTVKHLQKEIDPAASTGHKIDELYVDNEHKTLYVELVNTFIELATELNKQLGDIIYDAGGLGANIKWEIDSNQ